MVDYLNLNHLKLSNHKVPQCIKNFYPKPSSLENKPIG